MEYKRVPIHGYEGEYEIDNNGVVYSLKSGKVLKQTDFGSKYLQVSLCKNGVRKVATVHRLVAQAFLPNPDGLPQVNHKDEDKHNNKADNLEWCTASYNYWYGTCPERVSAAKKGKSPSAEVRAKQSVTMKKYWAEHRHPLEKRLIICINDNKVYRSFGKAAKAYGISKSTVKRRCDNPHKENRCGLNFRYAL